MLATLFALATNGLGTIDQILAGIIHDIAVKFNCDPAHIFRGGGKIRLLIGQDSGQLLLKPITHMCGKEIVKYIPEYAKDLSLQTTPASPMLSVCRSIGQGCSMDKKTSIFQCKVPKQHYTFFNDPSAIDVQYLQESHSNSTFSVMTTGPGLDSPATAAEVFQPSYAHPVSVPLGQAG